MKKYILILSFLIVGLNTAFAQRPGPGGPGRDDRREEIENFRIAFFTREIGLTSKEAEKFWPVYNEMQGEIQKLHRERRERHRSSMEDQLDKMSDAEIEKLISEEFASRQKELDIERKYHDRYKSILSMKKLALYYRAQEEFKRELVRKLQEIRKQ
jgi:hypothetical protein